VAGHQVVFGQALESDMLPGLCYLRRRFAVGIGLLDEVFAPVAVSRFLLIANLVLLVTVVSTPLRLTGPAPMRYFPP
jgi:hypothetical protein